MNSPIQPLNKMRALYKLKSWCFSIFISIVSNQLFANDLTLCRPAENVIFSCHLKNTKTVSICGSSDNAQSYVDYRFGRPSKIELVFSANAAHPKHIFHRGEVIYANNSADIIWFKSGKYRYSIFMPTRGGPGVEVFRNENIEARFECRGGWTNVKGKRLTTSKYIQEHGSGDVSKFEPLWSER